MRRRILREHHRLAAHVRHTLDGVAAHDTVAAVRPVNLLVDTRHGARVLAQLLHKQRHHVERRPPDVHFARCIRVAHGDRIVDEHEFELERLATGRGPHLAGLEAVVGDDDWCPSRPHVERHTHGVVHQRRVRRRTLHFRQFGARNEGVFLDSGETRVVGRFSAAFHRGDFIRRQGGRVARRTAAAETIDTDVDEPTHHRQHDQVE